MSSKKSNLGCLSVIGLVTVLGIAGGYVYRKGWHQLLASRSLTPLSGARVIPDEALMTGFVSSNSKHWEKLDKLGVEKSPEAIAKISSEIEAELSAANIDYQKDIEPWLGNVMFAIVPNPQSWSEPNMMAVLGIKNPLNAYKFLRKIQTNKENKLDSINYKGIKINLVSDSEGSQNNIALLGNKIVIADETAVVKQAIDTFKGEPSLASDPESKTALKQPLKLKNELMKVYITDYDRLLGIGLENSVDANKIAALQPVESLVMGVGTEKKQLNIQSYTQLKPSIDLGEYKPLKQKIARQFPPQTIALINGQGINSFWNTLVTLSQQDRDFKRGLDGVRMSARWLTGLDLDKDIFSWMDGEFALGIVPTQQAIIPELNLKSGLAFVLESSDRDTAQNTLGIVGNQLQNQLGIIPQTQEIDRQTVTNWSVPYSNIGVSYGWIDEDRLLLTLGNDVFASVSNGGSKSLPNSSTYKQLAGKLPKENLSYFYLDMKQAMTEVKQIPNLNLDEQSETMMLLNSIQSIGAASTMTDSQTTKTDFVVLFE